MNFKDIIDLNDATIFIPPNTPLKYWRMNFLLAISNNMTDIHLFKNENDSWSLCAQKNGEFRELISPEPIFLKGIMEYIFIMFKKNALSTYIDDIFDRKSLGSVLFRLNESIIVSFIWKESEEIHNYYIRLIYEYDAVVEAVKIGTLLYNE